MLVGDARQGKHPSSQAAGEHDAFHGQVKVKVEVKAEEGEVKVEVEMEDAAGRPKTGSVIGRPSPVILCRTSVSRLPSSFT
jgi:hypothetical protein